jgi:hypothetical protein
MNEIKKKTRNVQNYFTWLNVPVKITQFKQYVWLLGCFSWEKSKLLFKCFKYLIICMVKNWLFCITSELLQTLRFRLLHRLPSVAVTRLDDQFHHRRPVERVLNTVVNGVIASHCDAHHPRAYHTCRTSSHHITLLRAALFHLHKWCGHAICA